MKDMLVGWRAGTGPGKGRCPCDRTSGATDQPGWPHLHTDEQAGPADKGRATVTGQGQGYLVSRCRPYGVFLCRAAVVTSFSQVPEAKQAFLRPCDSLRTQRGGEGLVLQMWPLWSGDLCGPSLAP